jgi:hypothetical protein
MNEALPYFVGTVDTLKGYGVDTDGLRKSLTGEVTEQEIDGEIAVTDTRLAIVHQENLSYLSPDTLRLMRADEANVHWYFGEEATALMNTPEWTDGEMLNSY